MSAQLLFPVLAEPIPLPGLLIGELVGIIALFAMLIGGETTENPEPVRTVLGGLHGLAAVVGLVFVLWELEYGSVLVKLFAVGGNLFNFCIFGVMLAIVYPERREGGSLWPMLEVTFGPFVMAVIWTTAAVLVFDEPFTGAKIIERPLLLMGFHYYLVSGGIIAAFLFRPSDGLFWSFEPEELWQSGLGLFWFVLTASWWMQAYVLFRERWQDVFGDSLWLAILAAVLSLIGVLRTVQLGIREIDGINAR